jgi:hypothetical protein
MTSTPAFDAVLYSLEHRSDHRFADELDMRALAALDEDERRAMQRILIDRLAHDDDPRLPWALVNLSLDEQSLAAALRALARPAVAVSAAAALREATGTKLRAALIAGLDGPDAPAAAHELRHFDGADVDTALADFIERRGDTAAVATQSIFWKHRLGAWKPPVHLRGLWLLEALLSTEFASLRRPAVPDLRALLAVLARNGRPSELGYAPVDPPRSPTLQKFLASMDAPGDYDAASLAQLEGEERRWCEYMLPVQELLGNHDARAARVLGKVRWPATIDPLRAALSRTRGAAPVEAARALLVMNIEDARTEALATLRRAAAQSDTREAALAVTRDLGVI